RMKLIRQRSKSASVLLVTLMVLLTVPFQSVLAAMIETEATLDMTVKGQEARNTIKTILAREDAQAVLRAQGIDPLEARARVDSLTDAEAVRIADQIEELPAGGNFLVGLLIAVGVIVIILAITDALGYTDVFTFIR
ncbi:MAG: PA2779 family protein, partial [Desulfobacterales bacterium]|nr:PA2779 family protein [Desulfobacterales bacterium]